PIPPDGVSADKGVGDLDAVPMLKLMRLREAISISQDILAQDMMNAAYWMDIRKLEDPTREFGAAPTAAWTALRKILPFRPDAATPPPENSDGNIASGFLKSTPASTFYNSSEIEMPGGRDMKPPL